MEKKILVAIDSSRQSSETIDYAAHMADVLSQVRFVLLHIQPTLSRYLTEEAQLNKGARVALEAVIAENAKKAHDILDKAATRMIGNGVDDNRIERVTLPRNIAVADDILALNTAQSYDAVLVSRRGASYLQQWLTGSVTANLVEHTTVTPIWVVDGSVTSRKILLAADGSQSTLRALDHLAFMLSGRPEQNIQMLHIRPRIQDYCEITVENQTVPEIEEVVFNEDQHCLDDFYRQAVSVLVKNGIEKERMQMLTLDLKFSVPRSILGYARENGFGTVVLGRRGRSKSPFFGSVSRGLLQKAENVALWVVP